MTTRNCAIDANKKNCTCTFTCGHKGICCECVDNHRRKGELPGCYFPKEVEPSGDRSISGFINVVKRQGTAYLN
ncbi:MAG: DUF6485 family protein [Treponema sp.]|jgi:hypothetical protein|nr:DUF6485 family protein [Treponema sp.]